MKTSPVEPIGARGRDDRPRLARGLWPRYSPFFEHLQRTAVAPWRGLLEQLTCERLQPSRHGDLATWVEALLGLPAMPADSVVMDAPCVTVAARAPSPEDERMRLRRSLERLHPWRKGPFCLHGIRVDAEWRSDLKWQRLAAAASPLAGRRVLDIGCGNGYYGYRALGAGAALVLGIDPTVRFVFQFLALNAMLKAARLAVLPLADDDLPALAGTAEGCFDTLFSMGVLYHRREPMVHLERLRRCLRPDGELVLETLVIDGTDQSLLVPQGRYAQMRNVHAVPTVPTLIGWLEEAGFERIRLADLSRTTADEQRSTAWMRFHSLTDFLDPLDPARTVEGHPAPLRAMLVATRAASARNA